MEERKRPILGREALYSIMEFFRASLGSEKMFLRISRASKLEVFFLLWLVQSFFIVIGNYEVSARIRYNYMNIPYWITSADIWLIEDRALNMAVMKSLLLVPGVSMVLILARVLIMKVLGEGLKGKAYFSSAVTAFSTTLVPECLRVIAIYAIHLLRLPSEVIIDYDLAEAKSTRYLAYLATKISQDLQTIYKFNKWDVIVISLIFLAWETYLFYKTFGLVYELSAKRAMIASFILSAATASIIVYSSLIPWIPKFYINPFEFRFLPPSVPVG